MFTQFFPTFSANMATLLMKPNASLKSRKWNVLHKASLSFNSVQPKGLLEQSLWIEFSLCALVRGKDVRWRLHRELFILFDWLKHWTRAVIILIDIIDMRRHTMCGCYLEKRTELWKPLAPLTDSFPPKIALLEAKRYGEQWWTTEDVQIAKW